MIMKVSRKKLKQQSETRTIQQMADLYEVSYGCMWKILHEIGYTPKSRAREKRIEVVD